MAIHKVLSLEIQHVHVRLWKLTVFLVYQETDFGSNKIYTSTKNKKNTFISPMSVQNENYDEFYL